MRVHRSPFDTAPTRRAAYVAAGALLTFGCGLAACGSSATSTTSSAHGDPRPDAGRHVSEDSANGDGGLARVDASSANGTSSTADANGGDSETATEQTCAACVIIERMPELGDEEWIDADHVAASVLDFRDPNDPHQNPLTPPGHALRDIVWSPDREWIVATHEERPASGELGAMHISAYSAAADFERVELEPPAAAGTFGVVRVAGLDDEWPSILSHTSDAGLTTHYAYDLDPEGGEERNLGAITDAVEQQYAYLMPGGHGVIFRSPLPGGTNFDCQWHHWDNTLPANLQHLVDARCTEAVPRFGAGGDVFAMRLEDEANSQRERVVIYDSTTLEPVMSLPSADQARLSFGPEGSRFVYHVGYFSLVGDVGTSDYDIFIGDAERGWLQNIEEWGREPLGGVPSDSPAELWPLVFTDPDTLMVSDDEPYLVSFDGGAWRGLGNPTAAYEPFVVDGQLGYITDQGIYFVSDDFLTDSGRISHAFEDEQAFLAPMRIAGGFAYQTYWWVDDTTRKYRLRVLVDGQAPMPIEGLDERPSYFSVTPLQALFLDGLPGSLVHAPGGADMGQLCYLSETLTPTLLATDVSGFR